MPRCAGSWPPRGVEPLLESYAGGATPKTKRHVDVMHTAQRSLARRKGARFTFGAVRMSMSVHPLLRRGGVLELCD